MGLRGRGVVDYRGLVSALLPLVFSIALASPVAVEAAQAEEYLSPSVATLLSQAIADRPVPADYGSREGVAAWVAQMSPRLAQRVADPAERRDLLATVHYEATRAGLDPQLVLAVMHHESGFKKYAVSIADARGYMQVMPFWTRVIGGAGHNLFHLRTNLRYGCVILRHYLDRENGDLVRALGRYNGSLGRVEYPMAVAAAMRRYEAVASVSFASPVATLPGTLTAVVTR
ncbi:MAG TPA: lytic transglycosylase domain-containing protein [Casimicrobiaceae bacterium]|nr:lytic transglycosylase domain-containing protein [Casimicrobiaceae bacterium]